LSERQLDCGLEHSGVRPILCSDGIGQRLPARRRVRGGRLGAFEQRLLIYLVCEGERVFTLSGL
jgi:hypothetical protein